MLPGFGGHLISETFLERRLSLIPESPGQRALVEWLQRARQLGPSSGVRALIEVGLDPLVRALGFPGLSGVSIAARRATATLASATSPIAIVTIGWGERLDPLWRDAIVSARERNASWCLLFNGTHLRLIDATRLYSRRYSEFALDVAIADDRTRAALLAVCHATSFQAAEGISGSRLRLLTSESDRHTAAVSRSLKDGVLEASREVLQAIARRADRASLDNAFEQALTIVYRLLFLLFAEARALVPIWHPIYRESYSVEALRDLTEQGAAAGLWDAIRAVSRLVHRGCHAGDLLVTAFNGRLFEPAHTPLADRRDLDDDAGRRALLALSTRPGRDRTARERVSYRDLGVEQLGAVYETLLDYRPQAVDSAGRPPGRRSPRIVLKSGSGTRKATGTFYTPQPIAHYLVRRTLGPLVRDATPDQILRLRVLDPAMGSGAFLVAAASFLAEAYEAALVAAGSCHASDISPSERTELRRTIAARCLYGVDLNPMAVQLARLSLWLATLAADKPLSFLDHHLRAGNSLVGAWLSSLRSAPRNRRRAAVEPSPSLFGERDAGDALRAALPLRFALHEQPDDTAEQVRQKEHVLASLAHSDSPLAKWKRVADLWCAGWFGSSTPASSFATLTDAILTGRSALPDATAAPLLERAERASVGRRFFHWELEFPEVFFDAEGRRLAAPGFDAIIGNPPWEMVRADTGSTGHRSLSRRDAESFVRFTKEAGVYTHRSGGHINEYQLFVERSIALLRPGGRIGLAIPWGIAADHGSAGLRRLLFTQCAVDALVGFDNRARLFPIHRSVRFVLVTAARSGPTVGIRCRLGESDPAVLDSDEAENEDDRWYPVRLTPALLERLSGPDLTIPNLRSSVDLAVAERAATMFPCLSDPAGWHAHFSRELNATDDRASFSGTEGGLPVIEGKGIRPFRLEPGAARHHVSAATARRLLGSRHLRPRLAYRDVASATNRVTLIAAILPAGCVSTHTLFCLREPFAIAVQQFLCGLFNSLVLNYLVRLRVSTHVTTAIVERLPVPRLDAGNAMFREIGGLARLLARRDHDAARVRLNAAVARLYRLTSEELNHVLGTFPLIPQKEQDAVRHEFGRIA